MVIERVLASPLPQGLQKLSLPTNSFVQDLTSSALVNLFFGILKVGCMVAIFEQKYRT